MASSVPDIDGAIEAADLHVSSWKLSVSSRNKEITMRDGSLEQMMPQAHLYFDTAVIKLHQPLSDLALSVDPRVSICKSNMEIILGDNNFQSSTHTYKCLAAANALSSLTTMAKLAVTFTCKLLFLSCCLAWISTVHCLCTQLVRSLIFEILKIE